MGTNRGTSLRGVSYETWALLINDPPDGEAISGEAFANMVKVDVYKNSIANGIASIIIYYVYTLELKCVEVLWLSTCFSCC